MQALLKNPPLSKYLPNLTQIQLFMDPSLGSPDPGEVIKCISVPTLRELTIGSYTGKNSERILPKLAEALGGVQASLRSLELSGMPLEGLEQLFEAQPRIRVLAIRAKIPELGAAWQAAGTLLPELQFLKFTTGDPSQNKIILVDADQSRFPSLTEVELGLHAESLSDFLGCVSSPHLQSMRLGCTTGRVAESATSPVQCTAADHIHRFERLRTLQLHWWDRSPWDATTSLPLHLGLANLSIQGGGVYTCLGNDAIKSISQAFPNLESLEIVEKHAAPGHGPPLITIRGLQPLIDSCPKLRILFVTVDARCGDTLNPWTSAVREALEELDFQRSWVKPEDVEVIADLIFMLWPNLKRTKTAWGERARDSAEQKQCWDSVWELVGAKVGRTLGAVAWHSANI